MTRTITLSLDTILEMVAWDDEECWRYLSGLAEAVGSISEEDIEEYLNNNFEKDEEDLDSWIITDREVARRSLYSWKKHYFRN